MTLPAWRGLAPLQQGISGATKFIVYSKLQRRGGLVMNVRTSKVAMKTTLCHSSYASSGWMMACPEKSWWR
jgi:hypothetical protein